MYITRHALAIGMGPSTDALPFGMQVLTAPSLAFANQAHGHSVRCVFGAGLANPLSPAESTLGSPGVLFSQDKHVYMKQLAEDSWIRMYPGFKVPFGHSYHIGVLALREDKSPLRCQAALRVVDVVMEFHH